MRHLLRTAPSRRAASAAFPVAVVAALLLTPALLAARAQDSAPETPRAAAAAAPTAYVAYGGYKEPGGVLRFAVDPQTGALKAGLPPAVPPTGWPSPPARLVLHPDGRSAYLTRPVGATMNKEGLTISQYAVSPDSAWRPLAPATLEVPEGLASSFVLAPDGRSAYTVSTFSDTIWRYGVDPRTGALSRRTRDAVEAADAPPGARALAIKPGGDSAYAVGVRRLRRYRVGADGALTAPEGGGGDLLTANWGSFPRPMVFGADGRTAYVPDNGGGVVRAIAVGEGGGLSLLPSAARQTNEAPLDLAVTPDGRLAYLIYSTWNTKAVAQFSVAADGSLAPLAPARVPTGEEAEALAVEPGGRALYVLCRVNGAPQSKPDSGEIWQYRINADGTLTPLTPPVLKMKEVPRAIAFPRP
jgi:6-phosphogluconolactonase (cycloisomerase 2 family)